MCAKHSKPKKPCYPLRVSTVFVFLFPDRTRGKRMNKPTAAEIVEFITTLYGSKITTNEGEVNILYLEGCTAATLQPNQDRPDLWNDTRCIIQYINGVPTFTHLSDATSEPGLSATHSKRAAALGGVFRIAIGWHEQCWQLGFHQRNPAHPALVQCAPIRGHRDRNRDGKRTADPITWDVTGLNQHGTRPGVRSTKVGMWSLGCLVGQDWNTHIDFYAACAQDRRAVADSKFKFSTTIVDYSQFWKWRQQKTA